MMDKTHKKDEIILSILEFLERNGYKQSFERLQQKINIKYPEQNNKIIENLIISNKIPELITYITNNTFITNEEKLDYIKLLKIKYYIKLVSKNCINHVEQKDSLDYLRTKITPLLNQDLKSNELLNSLTYILFIKDQFILEQYIKNFLLSYADNDFIINKICKKNITPLEQIYNNYNQTIHNANLCFDDYLVLDINYNCLPPFKPSEVWFIEISKNKNYICAGFSNANISIFKIHKENKNNKDEITITLDITFSGNEENKRDEITAINFSNDEKYILVGLSNFKLIIFDITNGQKIKEYKDIHTNKITSIIPFPNSNNNNKYIISSIDKKINILDISNITKDINNNNEINELGKFCRIRQICFSELLNYLIIVSASNTQITIYNIINKKIEFKIITSEVSQNVYINTSKTDKGKYLIYSTSTIGKQSRIILYNLTTKLIEEKFYGFFQKYMIIKCCFCGIGDKYILSGSEDYTIYIWERGYSSMPKYKFQGHFGIVNTVDMWGNDFIISGSDDKSIKIWYSKNENLSIKYEKNKENKYVQKENKIDKEFLDAMNDENSGMEVEEFYYRDEQMNEFEAEEDEEDEI